MTTHVTARSISLPVARFLARPRLGTVLAIFARSAYLNLAGSVVALVAEELLNGPLNVVLSDPVPSFADLVVGDAVKASGDVVALDRWAISLRSAAPWDPRITPWIGGQMVRVVPHLRVLEAGVMADVSADHLMHARMQQALGTLRAGLSRKSPADIQRAAAGLAGLGSGLTPSGDDVLVGVMVALTALPDRSTSDLRDVIRRAVAGRTTQISKAYLDAAARGEASEAWQRLLAALAATSSADVIAAGRRVLAFGETSGADMLTGFLLTMGAVAED